MRHFMPWMVVLGVLCITGIGCGKPKDNKTETPTGSETGAPANTPEGEKSASAVRSFISAMLQGKDDQAFALLSQKAQEEYKKYNRGFAFPANDETEFNITAVSPIEGSDNSLFGVAVTMLEKYADGDKVTESSWGVRNDNGKYCIVGVVLNDADAGMTMELNFEDLAGSEAKIRQQMEQMQQQEAKIATAPGETAVPSQQGIQLPPSQPAGVAPDFQLPPANNSMR